MHPRTFSIAIVLLLAFCLPYTFAQNSGDPFASIGSTTAGTKSYQTQGAVLILTVYGDKHALLDRQSVVKLKNKTTQSTMWQTTTDKSEAYFVDLVTGAI
jgi:hypothetical protein